MNKKPHFLIQFVIILVAFTAILLQGFTHVIKMKPLAGYVPDDSPLRGGICRPFYVRNWI